MSKNSVNSIAARCICVVFFVQLSITVAHAQITGLDFPGSSAVTTTMRFKFSSPQDNRLQNTALEAEESRMIGGLTHDSKLVITRRFFGETTMVDITWIHSCGHNAEALIAISECKI